jgi:predicted CoA-binding protein
MPLIMATTAEIDGFLEGRRIVLIGVSVCPTDVTRLALRTLTERGHDIVPVRSGVKELEGRRAYPSLDAVPGTIDGAMIFAPKTRCERIVYDCLERHVHRFWLDPGELHGVGADALELCERHAMDWVVGGHWRTVKDARRRPALIAARPQLAF